jgi:hypothetical protein
MSSGADTQSQFEALHAGLRLIRDLEQQVDSSPRLESARIHLAGSGRQIGTAGFSGRFSKAMGMISSIAVANGYDDLAEEALELGGDAM